MKKEVIIVGIIIILLAGFYLITKEISRKNVPGKERNEGEIECVNDVECTSASCCHANSCISVREKPDCKGIYCTQVCEPGTLDCGQGECNCVNNKCKAVLKEGQ